MPPHLSVVVAAHNARESVGECLARLEGQRRNGEFEIIIVDNSTDGTCEVVQQGFPDLQVARCPESYFIPQMWECGINLSSGAIVALTTAHCVPEGNWVGEILRAHQSAYAGIGGAIENDPSAKLAQWAIYFCRYSHYMLPFAAAGAREIPGDNASYKRWALERFAAARKNGFWEPVIHAEFRKEGLGLLMTPAIVVRHKRSFSPSKFIRQRYWHGREFGSSRAASVSGAERLLYALASPLIPLVYFFRISRQVLIKQRNVTKFVLSIPWLMVFLLSWTAGELTGYLWTERKA